MGLVNLSTHSLVRVSGEGAEKLLNDTLSGSIDSTMTGIGRWFALLSPQGKILAEGLVTFNAGSFWFDLEAGYVADFVKKLKLYRLRAKADIEDVSDRFASLWKSGGDAGDERAIAYRDNRHPSLGTRFIIERELAVDGETKENYDLARIGAGIMEMGADFGTNEMFPHDIGMDFLGGVDFKKGCYIGQEVVSRMQHRGTARRRPVIISALPDGAAAGAQVMVGERDAGTIGAPSPGQVVAVLRLDRVTDPEGATLGGMPVKLTLPDWAPYQFGGVPAEA